MWRGLVLVSCQVYHGSYHHATVVPATTVQLHNLLLSGICFDNLSLLTTHPACLQLLWYIIGISNLVG